MARLGLWVFALGNLGWIGANLFGATPSMVNALTDMAIVVGAFVAAAGLRDAIDDYGPRKLQAGLLLVAIPEFAQNLVSAFTKLGPTNAAPIVVVMLAAIVLGLGALRWRAGWDQGAAVLAAAGFLGLAFEPIYYVARNPAFNASSGYLPGSIGVALGGLLAALAFRPGSGRIMSELGVPT